MYYLTNLHCVFKEYVLFNRINSLHSQTVHPLPEHLITDYEVVDIELGICMEETEKNSRILHIWDISWSTAYNRYALPIYTGKGERITVLVIMVTSDSLLV